jgi:hypothetical protein
VLTHAVILAADAESDRNELLGNASE